jgi:hypothetical protein
LRASHGSITLVGKWAGEGPAVRQATPLRIRVHYRVTGRDALGERRNLLPGRFFKTVTITKKISGDEDGCQQHCAGEFSLK